MLYREFRDQVLQLINLYSACGVELTPLQGDQADYLLRIPGLYNAAVTDISRNGRASLGTLRKEDCGAEHCNGGMVKITLPPDFIAPRQIVCSGSYSVSGPLPHFYRLDREHALIDRPSWESGVLIYEREPQRLPVEPGADLDLIPLDGDPEQQYMAALYVAAQLVLTEDAFVYQALQNTYQDHLVLMRSRRTAVLLPVVDSLGVSGFYG